MLRNFFCIFSLIAIVIVLSACQSDQLRPIKEETFNFDINTAIEMVEKREEMIIDVAQRDKVSVQEYEELVKSFSEQFGDHAKDILDMFFIHNLDAEPESDIDVQKNTLYPTVFHEGITITDAVVYKSYYENEFFNKTTLTIKEQYSGDDEDLKDWTREYIFTLNDNDEWVIHGFSGVMNLSGERYSMNYLELKR